METIYNQMFDKIITSINKPEFKNKLNQHVIDPFIEDVYHKIYNYFITIIILYSITIILLLFIIFIITKKYKLN
jgi:hypothetical protein